MSTGDSYVSWDTSHPTIHWGDIIPTGAGYYSTNIDAAWLHVDLVDPMPIKDLQCIDGWDPDENNF